MKKIYIESTLKCQSNDAYTSFNRKVRTKKTQTK